MHDIHGREHLDGLSVLWNVNIGQGGAGLTDAAAAPMKGLAYFCGYVGSSNIPAMTLTNRLVELTNGTPQAVFTTGGPEANESAFTTARFFWKVRHKPDTVKVIGRYKRTMGSRCRR